MLVRKELLEHLRCTQCGADELVIGSGRRPALCCPTCETVFPVVEGIPDMIPPDDAARPGQYRTDSLGEFIGGLYDVLAPMMSLAVWHCSPLRYIDVEHRAVGRANPGGLLLEAPIGTGVVLDKVLADYHDITVIGVDTSWKMLRKAHERFRDCDRVHVVRARADHLPLSDDVVDSVQSLNGLHRFNNRSAVLAEFRRVARDDAYISGSALIRGQELVADAVLDRYERWGILPMLRTGEFLVKEMRTAGLTDVHFETHGAVLFYRAANA